MAPRQARLRLNLASHDPRLLDQTSDLLVATAHDRGAKTHGPIPLPVSEATLTDPRTHRRRIDILNPPSSLTDAFIHHLLPAGVDVEVSF
jgi:small subunit ribosomal protein S10